MVTEKARLSIDELLDREAIRALIISYNALGDRGRVAEMAEVFTPDARLTAVGRTAIGRGEIAALLSANPLLPEHRVTRHHIGTQTIDLDGDEAVARSYFSVLTNIGLDHHGVYIDRLRRQANGAWLITEREVRLDWQAPNSVYAPLPVHSRG
jgi:uncharacterized protein (TIGR02246 family)